MDRNQISEALEAAHDREQLIFKGRLLLVGMALVLLWLVWRWL
jgi:hypothetical protein